jgi:hypothetical protein
MGAVGGLTPRRSLIAVVNAAAACGGYFLSRPKVNRKASM